MSTAGFDRCLQVAWLPENDGQRLHTTSGDAGGATNMGVIFSNFVAWRQRQGAKATTLAEFAAATDDELGDILHAWFWLAVQGDHLPVGVDLVVFEACLMSSPAAAARILQGVVGADQDGRLGPMTLEAVKAADPAQTIQAFVAAYLEHVNALPSAVLFSRGWDRRINDDQRTALTWVQVPSADTAAVLS